MESGCRAMQACLTKDPRERPSADALLQHDWIRVEQRADALGIPEVCCQCHAGSCLRLADTRPRASADHMPAAALGCQTEG